MAHKHRDDVVSRLARIEGHVSAVKRMVGEDRACADILQQIAAIKAAINQVSRLVLEDHLENCIVDLAEQKPAEVVLDELKATLSGFLKQS